MRVLLAALTLVLCCEVEFVRAEDEAADPWLGCWARVYSPAHLDKHAGQLVTAMTVAIDPRESSESAPVTHDARIAVHLRGKEETYTALEPARCALDGEEMRCFLDGFLLGSFWLSRGGETIKLILREGDGVSLVPGVDLSAFVRLDPANPEHTVFLLNRMPADACGSQAETTD